MKNSILIFILPLVTLFSCAPGGNTSNDLAVHPSIATIGTAQILIESHHPYGNNHDNSWEINAPEGTTSIVIPFNRLETEQSYDFVKIYDGEGTLIHNISGLHNEETFVVQGNYARIALISDYSIDEYGILITEYHYTIDVNHPTDHRPYCGSIGTSSEGWYWGDTEALIKLDACADADEPRCEAIGSRSEGWYSSTGRIGWDFCHATLRISLMGENCGPSIGFTCYDNLFCAGLPLDTNGGTGVCVQEGQCTIERDCFVQNGNPACQGTWSCQNSQCVAMCVDDPVEEGIWSWTTFMVQNIESDHPYANEFSNTWTASWSGATKFKVHFQQYDMENNYDYITYSGRIEDGSVRVTGADQDVWSQEFDGDTFNINMATDYSVTKYGFNVDQVSIYHQLPLGACNVDSECNANEFCHPDRCFSQYAPCHGTCQPQETTGNEGDLCNTTNSCNSDLFCKNVDENGNGTCQEEQWCSIETTASDCADLIHITVPGNWGCVSNVCSWEIAQFGGTFDNIQKIDIPDNDPIGIMSTINISNIIPCDQVVVTATLDVGHTYIGDLVVTVTDPSGIRHKLSNREGGSTDDINIDEQEIPLGLSGVNGEWLLNISDHASYDTGTLEYWSITVGCMNPHPF
jgi:Proprotein convertase P-domain